MACLTASPSVPRPEDFIGTVSPIETKGVERRSGNAVSPAAAFGKRGLLSLSDLSRF